MYVSLGSVAVDSVRPMQTTLRDLGYLPPAGVDGVFGPGTGMALVRLGQDAIHDFLTSLSRGGGSAEEKGYGERAVTGALRSLQSTIVANKYANTPASFDAIKSAQTKLNTYWLRWIRTGGRAMTPRALAFTTMVLSRSSAGAGAGSGAGAGAGADWGLDQGDQGDKGGISTGGIIAIAGVAFLLFSLTSR